MNLSKHPYDWIIHAILCFIPLWQNWATWFVVVFVAVMLEYEQWSYAGKPRFWQYFWYKVFGDLVADTIGIIVGVILW